MREPGQGSSPWRVWGSDYLPNVMDILFQHCDDLSLFPMVLRTGEFIALANQEDNIQTNDYNITGNIYSKFLKRHVVDIWGGGDHFFGEGE